MPQVESRRDRKDIVIKELKDKHFSGAAVFDGMLLFSPIRLEMPARWEGRRANESWLMRPSALWFLREFGNCNEFCLSICPLTNLGHVLCC